MCPRRKRNADPFRVSILDIPYAEIALRVFGGDGDTELQRVKRWFSGTQALTVAHFWELYQAFPFVDIERSLEDLYDRRLRHLAKYKRANAKRQIKHLTNDAAHDTTDAEPDDGEPA